MNKPIKREVLSPATQWFSYLYVNKVEREREQREAEGSREREREDAREELRGEKKRRPFLSMELV